MTPQDRQLLTELDERVRALETVRNMSFIKEIVRRLANNLTVADLPAIKLSDLSDVEDTDTATTGEILKKTATTWKPGLDNT